MTTRNIASLGAIALAYGGIMVMCAADGPTGPAMSADAKAAAREAGRAAKALKSHEADAAVAAAERAVALSPREAAYRMLLGQGYLEAGRFQSAGQAFGDALQLDGGNGKAALDVALTEIAAGDWQAARRTLTAHADTIPASDRGLAMALAGDTAGAVELLTAVARSPGASPKVRQNLALAYALGGQWGLARVIAAADMSPADVDKRIEQWAAFAQPQSAADQVASLLGVRPAADAGEPTALALNAPVAPAAPVAVAAAPPVAAPVTVAAPAEQRPARVTFAPAREVVQALPAPVIQRASVSFKTPAPTPRARLAAAKPVAAGPASGQWFVQLGAYDSAGVAKDGWGRATRRYAAFRGHQPTGMTFRSGSATFYRLSVGGFSRAAADQACRQYRARGGACFVRMGAGDQLAQWVKPKGVQLAKL